MAYDLNVAKIYKITFDLELLGSNRVRFGGFNIFGSFRAYIRFFNQNTEMFATVLDHFHGLNTV